MVNILSAVATTLPHLLLYLSLNFHQSYAILQTAAIDIEQHHADGSIESFTMLASQASFGANPLMSVENNLPMNPQFPPNTDPLLCNEANGINDYLNNPTKNADNAVMLVPRGVCSFERKALSAQRLGASSIIIYGTLASRYSLNTTTDEIIYPTDRTDYDCNRASASIPASALSFDPPPYNSKADDAVLSGSAEDGNLCAIGNDRFEEMCPSQRCLLTGETDMIGRQLQQQQPQEDSISLMKACCAWDLPIWLYADGELHKDASIETVEIPGVYVTMEQGALLMKQVLSSTVTHSTITMYRRYAPDYNLSGLVIWALGVFVAALAAYLSASDYRNARKNLALERANQDANSRLGEEGSDIGSSSANGQSKLRNRSNSPENRIGDNANATNTALSDEDQQQQPEVYRNGYERVGGATAQQSTSHQTEETLELTEAHAIGFVFFSAAGLLTLFYFKIYSFVKVMYGFSCCNAMVTVIFGPLYSRIFRKLRVRDSVAFSTATCEIGAVAYTTLLAAITSYSLGAVWMYIAFTVHHPDSITFFWVMQDVMGACVCITFLSVIKLNSIKVATMLLIAAFFYDIFFVFITPYLTKGGKSIMIDVATGGGPPKADPAWCEKYPDEKDCQGGDLLPMLLTVPRLFDYAGGSSLLGLGDIVLPGLLLSFGARYDEAKRFIGAQRDGGGRVPRGFHREICPESKGGYFIPLIVAYAIGLLMANTAVYVMQMGQPALLYLVPCCLGTICFIGWRRNELSDMWKTPRVLATSDELLYGEKIGDGAEDNVEEEEVGGEAIHSSTAPNDNELL